MQAIEDALAENNHTLAQLVEPSLPYQADFIEDYMSDAALMIDDDPEAAKAYIEIALKAHRARRKAYNYTAR